MKTNNDEKRQTDRDISRELELELEQEFKKEREKKFEKDNNNSSKSKFTVFQTIALLTITLLLSTGGGLAFGHFYIGDSIEMKRVNEQLEYYKERVRINPNSLEDRIVLGYTYYLKGDNNRAVNEFKYVLNQDENYYDAYYNLGLVYLEEEKYNDALSMFNKTVQIAPRDYKGHAQMGVAYRNLKLYDEAIASLDEANRLAPANSDIIYQIGLVAEAVGEYESAAEIYKDALVYDPLFKDALNALDRLEKSDLIKAGEKNE